jgi:putative transposase
MPWLLTTQVRRDLKHYGHNGHVWQGRFQAFATQDDDHRVTVVRDVERNPLRAGLGSRAEDWRCSSLGATRSTTEARPQLTADEWLHRGAWVEFVNAPMREAEAEAIRLCIRRERPYGTDGWTGATAERLGPQSSIRPREGQRRRGTEIAPNL